MGLYYDRAGRKIDLNQWAADFANNRVAETTLADGKWVSTVYLGLDHSFGKGLPLIFETMVFSPGREELDQERYSTESEAVDGHARMVAKWKPRGLARFAASVARIIKAVRKRLQAKRPPLGIWTDEEKPGGGKEDPPCTN